MSETDPAAAPTLPDPPAVPLGRPRDEAIAQRALDTALEIYGHLGWSGFTLGKVAAQARIGKSSLYLRWPSKLHLLVDAFDSIESLHHDETPGVDGPPSFAERMERLVDRRLGSYFDHTGLAILRLFVEHSAEPGLVGDLWDHSLGRDILATRQELRRGIEAGDLRREASVVHLGDTLEGGMIMHALATPAHLRDRAVAGLPAYGHELAARTLGPWLTEQGRRGAGWAQGTEAGARSA